MKTKRITRQPKDAFGRTPIEVLTDPWDAEDRAQKTKRITRQPKDAFGRTPIEVLTARLEAMEMRESMLKEQIMRFERNAAGLQTLGEMCTALQAVQCAIYDKIANVYDLLKFRQAKTEVTAPAPASPHSAGTSSPRP
jgi:hypothetical protein